ncbi:EamA family transporter RarD [Thalassovita sp.]|uniref:EamA family transporter RarD n=1 Tax=Thalassovita sp. TaxID=1979401 RepID=UPI002AAFEC8D|nr:EamA family transporter RarD [Thalassovita sp.]
MTANPQDTATDNSAAKLGVLALVTACVVWGLSGLFYKLLSHLPPLQVLSHRTLWSCVFFALVLLVQGRLHLVGGVLRQPRQTLTLFVAALMIGANWFMFILSIQVGKATEASLGYYIFPLVSVLMGVVFFRERLGRLQWGAVALAVLAVSILTWGLGVAPWVSLLIAVTFGLYGVIKKKLTLGPVVSVTVEVLLLSPVALIILWQVWAGGGSVWGNGARDIALLMISGPLTATPLILFSFATKRVQLATVGLVQYLNPTLQFLVATLVFAEPFGPWHAIAFPIIWVALALYSGASLWQARRTGA